MAVPSLVQGLLTPRLSPPLSTTRSHARSRSPDVLNRRSERRSDRSLIACSIHSLDERAADVSISAVDIKGEQEGEHRGGTPPPREVFPLALIWPRLDRGRYECAAFGKCFRQLQSVLRVAGRAHRAASCAARQVRPPPARWSIAVPWRERPPFWTAWPAKPAATEVVAHATLSLPQPERSIVGRCMTAALNALDPRREQRPSLGDCAARNSRAQGAAHVLDFAPPALPAAHGLDRASSDPCPGNYRRPERKCLTTLDNGVTVGSSSPAAVRSRLHIARCGACSNRRSQTTVRSPLLKPLPGCPFVRRDVRETDNRIGLRFGLRPGADPTVHHTSKSSRCHGGTPVRSRCVGRCAQRAHYKQRHRRSEWAGVSWPKEDDHERDAAGGTGLALG